MSRELREGREPAAEQTLMRPVRVVRVIRGSSPFEETMRNEDIQEAVRHLRRQDPVMKEVIRKAGPFTMPLHRNRFRALVFSILGQQISGKAAASIRARLVEHLKPEEISPETIGRLTPKTLRSLGLSNQKASYVLDLAQRVTSGE